MQGRCSLPDGVTLQDDIEAYTNTFHDNFFTSDHTGFICVIYTHDYIFIPYAYRENTHKTLKEMVKFAKKLHKRYTIDNNLPIIYTGLVNFYEHHSRKIGNNLWVLEV